MASDPVLELANLVNDFADTASCLIDDNFFCTFSNQPSGITLRINCVDASSYLARCLKRFHSSVAFSATLKPEKYFRDLTGYNKINGHYEEFDSPFPSKNRKLLIIPQVSTKFKDRQSNYGKIAEAIGKILEVRKGNYIVFFPSFAFLEAVAECLEISNSNFIKQTKGMPRGEIDATIEMFFSDSQVVLLAVQGGVFAEGIDFKGDALIGTIIVGPGLPAYSLQRRLMQKIYDQKFEGDGFNYAFTYPAMAKVVQAAGRVIRTENDKGLVVLMDRRFLEADYQGAMPSYWMKNPEGLLSQKILSDVAEFWSEA
jgi:DNA excision repair protein ERCC-2